MFRELRPALDVPIPVATRATGARVANYARQVRYRTFQKRLCLMQKPLFFQGEIANASQKAWPCARDEIKISKKKTLVFDILIASRAQGHAFLEASAIAP